MKENSIERDIHLLESYAGMTHKMNDNQGRPKLDQAIEHILSDYKRVLKENGELRERIKQLEDTNKKLYEIGKEIGKQHKYTSENYIPKSKVEEKIEELNSESYAEKLEDMMNTKNYTITELVQYVLQELLDGSDTDVGSIGSEN